ncbi:ABC-three component system protein [Lachnospiraceae bacterium 46-61]
MNRSYYFNYIEEKLNTLSYRIQKRAKLNLLDLNIYSESFFAQLMNNLLGYNLKNVNITKQNTEGIDLIDNQNKVIIQVSSTCSKQKIEKSLSKAILQNYSDFYFKFIAISGEATKLKTQIFQNPYGVNFSPANDIYDIKSLLDIILNMPIEKQQILYEFFKNELGDSGNTVKMDTNLAAIINILARMDLTDKIDSPEINSFKILKKIEYNKLSLVQSIIEDYKIYSSKLNEKYKEFDKQGVNKSFSVLSVIRKQYIKLLSENVEPYKLFYMIIDNLIELIRNSKNYIEIPYDELDVCVSILVVDAFIRCKIFENPEGYNYVIT